MIIRETLLAQLNQWKNKKVIKVITGVRRSGKSTLMRQFAEKLQKEGVKKKQCLEINFEDFRFQKLLDAHSLYDYVKKHLQPEKNYLFFDEIQMVPNFQKIINSLFLLDNVDIYITGSNAYLLSGELATLLSGRYVEIKVLPLSFAEFYSATGKDKDKTFQEYLKQGGFPYLLGLPSDMQYAYLESIVSTVLLKDVSQRLHLTDISLLQTIMQFLADNIGNITSAKKIADYLTSSGRKTSYVTVANYIKALTDAFLLYKADRFDIKGKAYLQSLSKYYIADLGLRNYLLGGKVADLGFMLENIVFLELCRRGFSVQIGKVGTKEIDFIARKADELIYYQVAASILDANTFQREISPLQSVKDNYPKVLLTLDRYSLGQDGINQKNLVDWLLE